MASEKNSCEGCIFWERIDADNVYPDDGTSFNDDNTVAEGYCKRYPPTVVSDVLRAARSLPLYEGKWGGMTPSGMLRSGTVWPVTYDCDCCGEFKPIDKPQD